MDSSDVRYADTYLVEAIDKTQITYNIKEGTRFIGSSAFSGCSSLTSLDIPESVISIGGGAFGDCSSLTSIDIPESVTSIGFGAFFECSGLTSITIPNNVTSIGQQAFMYCNGLTSVTIGNSVTSIGVYAFRDCSSLTSVMIGNSVTSIGYEAFAGCTSLPVIDNIRYADTYLVMVADWTQSTYNIKEGTRFIGSHAFEGCHSLTSITIPNSVTSIGDDAFYGCSGLTRVNNLSETPQSIYGDIFTNATLYVPKGCKATYEAATGWREFKEILETVSATLGNNGYTTFACPCPLDLENLSDGVVAYKAYAVSTTQVNFRSIEQTVPANTGILLKGTANAVVDIPVATEGEVLEDNLFFVNVGGSTFAPEANTTYYGLIKDSDPLSFGWFVPSSVAIPSNKAYLKITDGGARLSVSFEEDDITTINSIDAQNTETPKDGKFLENGKIVIVKNGVRYYIGGQKLNK